MKVKTMVYIDKIIKKKVKVKCAKEGKTISEVAENGFKNYIK